jgi:hypothetical protein
MPIGQQRISHPIAFFGLTTGLGENNAAQIVAEMARKEGFSLEFLHWGEMSRLRGGGDEIRTDETLSLQKSSISGRNSAIAS